MMNKKEFSKQCKMVRKDTLNIFFSGGRGHLGSSLSIVEILTALYYQVMNIDPKNPVDPNRDRFILSKGHGCISLYAILGSLNFFPKQEWDKFCQLDGILGGHPSATIPGIDASTGSLGHGLSIGVGMALHAKLKGYNYKTYVLLGDGECNEGSIWEAALSASQKKLTNLVTIVDYNELQSYGPLDRVCSLTPFDQKWESFGFETILIDLVNDPFSIINALQGSNNTGRPLVIICKTVKGMGIPSIENDLNWHHKTSISDAEKESLIEELDNA